MASSTGSVGALVPESVASSIKAMILDIFGAAGFGKRDEASLLAALGGRNRVLPEGKGNLCSALTFFGHSSTAGKESDRVLPVIAAMEFLLAAFDLVDDIEDDECPVPQGGRAVGEALRLTSSLLMLCHSAVSWLEGKGVAPERVASALRVLDSLALDALRGH